MTQFATATETLYVRSYGPDSFSFYETYPQPRNPLMDDGVADEMGFPVPVRWIASRNSAAWGELLARLSPQYAAVVLMPTTC